MRFEVRAVLAIDQAATSGVAFGQLGVGVLTGRTVGTTLRREHRVETLRAAVKLAGGIDHLAVVYEDHSEIPASSGYGTPTLLGMGDARGRWLELLESVGHPVALVSCVTMDEWRKALGFSSRRTEQLKAEAVRWASRWLSVPEDELDHNAAEAACILAWAGSVRPWLPEVRDALKAEDDAKRARKRARYARSSARNAGKGRRYARQRGA